MQKIAIGFEINDHTDENEISLFLDSFIEYGGDLSNSPIYILKPEGSLDLSENLLKKIESYDVNLIKYSINKDLLKFIFTDKVIASASLEDKLDGDVDILAWLAADTLFINEPVDFSMGENTSLGYRPVHHKLIGSGYDDPLDEFWSRAYELVGVCKEDIFPMYTCVGEKVRPYFNAGFLIVRPEKRILRNWHDNFLKNYKDDLFLKYYQKDVKYIVFVHQIILSATIVSLLELNEMVELPKTYNYPLNLLEDIPEEEKPDKLGDLVTARYDDYQDFFVKKKFYKMIDIDKKYRRWFSKH